MNENNHNSANGHGLSKRYIYVAMVGLLLAAMAVAIDGPVRGLQQGHELGGDVRREVEVWQQFGGVGSGIFVFLLLLCMHKERARRMLDWGAAYLLTMGVVQGLKMGIGRVRPSHGAHTEWLGPGGTRVVREGDAPIHAWEMGADGVARLWSMPSSHSAAGVVLAVFLGALYPKLRPLCAFMAVFVMFGRVWTGAHWLSDVLAGASIALLISVPVVRGYWGVRTVDWVWRTLVSKSAHAKYPEMRERGL